MSCSVVCEGGLVYKNLALAHSPPRIKAFILEETRRKTFGESFIEDKREELVESGFFSWIWNESVICYHCAGELKNWEGEVDRAHANSFPMCTYINVKKGRKFVQESRTSHRNITKSIKIRFERDIKDRNESLRSEDIEFYRRLGFSVDYLWSITEEFVKEHDRSFESTKEMAESLMKDMIPEEVPEVAPPSKINIDPLCGICLTEEKRFTFIPCGHLMSCAKCSVNVEKCPFCRANIYGLLKTFIV
jgi:E3 ubiquitin-protein ligase XIAP